MKRVFLMVMTTTAFIFTGYENRKATPNDNQADTIVVIDVSVDATADSLTFELDTQLSQNNTNAIQASLTSLQNKYAELMASNKPDTAKAYAAKIQLFLNGNAEEIKAATTSNATTAALVSGVQNLPTTVEATAGQTEAAIKNNAEEMMKEVEFKTNKTIDKVKREATKATDSANVKMNEAEDKTGKTLDKGAEEASKEVNQAREQIRKGLGL